MHTGSPPQEVETDWTPPEPRSDRSKTFAAMLAIFLGGIGLHKFYLGKSLQGAVYLVFCWTFVPAEIGFFEGIGLLLMSERPSLNNIRLRLSRVIAAEPRFASGSSALAYVALRDREPRKNF